MTDRIHYEILTDEQKELLPKLAFLKDAGFYLAGGTALALQIGHRTSIDFDFYKRESFDSPIISSLIAQKIPKTTIEIMQKDTILGRIGESGLSLSHYPYDIIKPFKSAGAAADLLSLEDIAAMKILAIGDRGRRRDFIDLYFLISIFGLEQIFEFVRKKYPLFDSYHAFLGLTYFKDAQNEDRKYTLIKKVPSWSDMKKFFINQALQYKNKMLNRNL